MALVYGGGILKDSQEHLQDLTQDPRERQAQVSTGAEGITSGAPSPGATAPATPTPTTPTAPAVPAATASYTPNLGIQGAYARYFSPLTQSAQQVTPRIQAAEGAFYTQAGPHRAYNPAAYEQILQAGIQQGGKDDTAELAKAGELTHAAYTGPQQIDQATVDEILKSITPVEDEARALRDPLAIQGLVGRVHPGLTAGERRYEAGRLSLNPEFQAAERAAISPVLNLSQQLTAARNRAGAYAGARTAEEADIARQSRDYLGSQATLTDRAIGEAMSRAQAEEAANMAAWQKILGSHDVRDLMPVAGGPGVDFNVGNVLNATPEVGLLREGRTLAQSIAEKYPELKDVPGMTLGISSHGRERLEFPTEWYKANKEFADRIRKQAVKRQTELEAAGFSPGSGKRTLTAGKFGEVLPLYYQQPFEPEDIVPYLDRAPSLNLNKAGVASDEQKFTMNAIHQLLDSPERLEGDSYKAAHIFGRIDDYLKAEEAKISKQKGEVSGKRLEWQQAVKNARDKFKQKKYNLAGRIVIGGMLGPIAGSIYEGAGHDKPIWSSDDSSNSADKGLGKLIGNIFGDYGK